MNQSNLQYSKKFTFTPKLIPMGGVDPLELILGVKVTKCNKKMPKTLV
jgi:hypothetical protein